MFNNEPCYDDYGENCLKQKREDKVKTVLIIIGIVFIVIGVIAFCVVTYQTAKELTEECTALSTAIQENDYTVQDEEQQSGKSDVFSDVLRAMIIGGLIWG